MKIKIGAVCCLFLFSAQAAAQDTQFAEAMAQIDRMQSEIQAVTGGLETQAVQNKQLREEVDRHYRDLEMRIGALEGQIKLMQDQLQRAVASVSPKLAQEGKDFQRGLDFLKAADYAKAVTAFQEFLKKYPKSPSRSDAMLWIAEARYSSKDYTQAIKDYQKFVEQFPKSSNAPAAVLKQGDGFLNLQMQNEAKVFYQQVIQSYPQSGEAAQARGKLSAIEKGTGVLTAPVAPTAPAAPVTPAPAPSPSPPTAAPAKESNEF